MKKFIFALTSLASVLAAGQAFAGAGGIIIGASGGPGLNLIPEPGAFGLAAAGAAAIILAARLRKRK